MNDESALVDQALAGDTAAYEQLVLRHLQAVRTLAIGFGAEWEDVVQETFLRACQRLDTLADRARFREWVLGIARNVCRDLLKRPDRANGPQWAAQLVPAKPETPAEEVAAVRKAVDELPYDYRIVIEMRHFERLGYADIGERLGLGPNGVSARLRRARTLLRDKLRQHDGLSK